MSDPMYPPPPPPGAPPPMAPMGSAGAAQQVQGPALGLMITAGIGLLFGLIGLAANALGLGAGALSSLGSSGPGGRYMHYMSGGIGIVSAIVGLAAMGFVMWGAMQMKQLRKWGIAVGASIVAMIPCFCPSCFVGIPVGIWALIVLMKPEVKNSFVG